MLHMLKNDSQLKNWTMPMLNICRGMCSTLCRISPNMLPRIFSALKRARSSGGYSRVVRTVSRMLARNTNAPMAKAILTEGGTTPGPASLETPSQFTNRGRLLATQVPMPMMKVCSTKP